MGESVVTGGLHSFHYEKRDYSEWEDRKIRQKWGNPQKAKRRRNIIYFILVVFITLLLLKLFL